MPIDRFPTFLTLLDLGYYGNRKVSTLEIDLLTEESLFYKKSLVTCSVFRHSQGAFLPVPCMHLFPVASHTT